MTTLIITPIDMSKPGSFRQRSKLMRAVALTRDSTDVAAVAAAYMGIEDLVMERLETDDGTPVADVLDQLSAKQFDELMTGMLGENAVPTPSAGS